MQSLGREQMMYWEAVSKSIRTVPCKPRNAVVLLTLFVVLAICGCKTAEKTWSAEARSPSGEMIATANTFRQSGAGIDGAETVVYLNWTTGSQEPKEILSFHDGPATPGGMDVGMKWLTPTHLELTYKGARPIAFQAALYAGVQISVRDISDGTVNTCQ